MPKIITSPVKRYSGTVTLSQPLTYPQYTAWRKSLDKLQEGETLGDVVANDEHSSAMLPGICACVEKWDLSGLGQLTPDSFPATPRVASARLLIWLMSEINAVIAEEDDSPLA